MRYEITIKKTEKPGYKDKELVLKGSFEIDNKRLRKYWSHSPDKLYKCIQFALHDIIQEFVAREIEYYS